MRWYRHADVRHTFSTTKLARDHICRKGDWQQSYVSHKWPNERRFVPMKKALLRQENTAIQTREASWAFLPRVHRNVLCPQRLRAAQLSQYRIGAV